MQTELRSPTVTVAAEMRLVVEALQWAFQRRRHFVVLGASQSSHELLRLAAAMKPDIVLAESSLARTPGLISAIVRASPSTRTVTFAVTNDKSEILDCIEAGVCGYVLRDAGVDEIHQSLDTVLRGEFACPPAIVACAFARIASLAAHRQRAAHRLRLPDRQTQILALIEEGLTNKEIACRLGIELSTVKNHIHTLLTKMGVRRRSQAVAKYRLANNSSA